MLVTQHHKKEKIMKQLLMKSIISINLLASLSFATTPLVEKKAETTKLTKLTTNKMNVSGQLTWTGFGVGKSHTGTITLKSGLVEMKDSNPIGGTFVLDMTSLKTGDSPKLEKHLKSTDFFDVEKFKEGIFKITAVETIKNAPVGTPTHKITGELTIKDKTHTEEFLAIITKKETTFNATAEAEIKDRTQYDIVYNSSKFKAVSVLGDKLIKDNIKIQLDLKTN